MRLSPVIGELQICRLVLDFSELLSVSASDSDPGPSESFPDCSSVCSCKTSYWCMSSLISPMYGCCVRLSCSSSCQWSSCQATTNGFPLDGTYSRMSYPLLLFPCLLGTFCMCVFSNATGLLVASCCRCHG